MQYPGQRVQINVKFVPQVCIVRQEESTRWYQYTFIDEYSHFRYLEAFPEHSTYSSALFIQHCVKRFPYIILLNAFKLTMALNLPTVLLVKMNQSQRCLKKLLLSLASGTVSIMAKSHAMRPFSPSHRAAAVAGE